MTDFSTKVFQAATQGAVASVVAASLSAVTEPIVNKVLLERIPLSYVFVVSIKFYDSRLYTHG